MRNSRKGFVRKTWREETIRETYT